MRNQRGMMRHRFSKLTKMSLAAIAVSLIAGCAATHRHDYSQDEDMDRPLAKAPQASFPSSPKQQREKQLEAAKAAEAANDPSHLPLQSLNTFRSFSAGRPLRIHALNVGAGACIVLECPGSNDVMLYDCGSLKRSSTDLTKQQVRDYVLGVVKQTEPIVMMSHAHADHVNLIPYVLKDTKARSIWIGGLQTDYGSDADETGVKADLNAWIQGQVSNGVPLKHEFEPAFNNGGEPVDELTCGDAQTYILTVNAEPVAGANDNRRMHANNLMVLVKYGDFKAILTGDAVGEAEAAALGSFGALVGNTTLLFASHHGAQSYGSNSDIWASAVRPKIVLYSADTHPTYGHPKGAIVDKFRSLGSLKKTKPHLIWKDPKKDSDPKIETRLAEYVTVLSGTLVIESDGTRKVSVTCSLEADCW